MLNKFELVRKTAAYNKLVIAACVLTANFIDDQSAVVLEERDSANQTVGLLALGVVVDLAHLVENGLLAILAAVHKFVFVHHQFGRPWRRHVQNLLLVIFLIVIVLLRPVTVVIITAVLFLGLDHDEFPVAVRVFLKIHVHVANVAAGVQVDPEVLVVEGGLNREIGAVFNVVLSASRWLNEKLFVDTAIKFLNKYPGVQAGSSVFVFLLVVGLVIVDSCLFADLLSLFLDLFFFALILEN